MVSILGSKNSTACNFLLPKASNLCNKGQCLLELFLKLLTQNMDRINIADQLGNSHMDKTFIRGFLFWLYLGD